ncbi:MAG: hypothetical protein BGO70_13590 [Bacteroidetes bacterium 43-93]|nr:hypothetical protein [Bacteroidota bacterium]OJW99468.1 MAG: hypothetical protein BGO70_13590 [Bacteroidetes bacterium 43-93]
MRSYHRLALSLLITLSISCNKQGPQPVKVVPASTHYFEAKYHLYDSTHYWWDNATQFKDTTIHYSLNRIVSVFMDTAAGYIACDNDTFRYNEIYPSYSGYYSFFRSPVENNKITLTKDTMVINISRTGASHDGTNEITHGYIIQ